MRAAYLLLLLQLITAKGVSQTKEQMAEYNSYKMVADSLFRANNYDSSIFYYTKAFQILNGKGYSEDKYNSAICYHAIGKLDSCYSLLSLLAQKTEYIDFHEMNNNHDFSELKKTSFWSDLKKLMIPESTPKYDSLAEILHSIYEKDQRFRKLYHPTKRYGKDTAEIQHEMKLVKQNDSLNVLVVTSMIDHFGWLGKNKIGTKANNTLWLVIQHSDTTTMKTYFPIMSTAVEKGDASRIRLAYLEDRILMFQGKEQIYGTQYQLNQSTGELELYKVFEPKKLSERRRSIGLSEY